MGVSRGTEIFAQAVRLALEDHREDPTWVSIKIDFKNAFNEVSRVAFLRFCAAHFPALLLFLLAAYGAPAYSTSQLSGRMVGFATYRDVAALRAAPSGRSASLPLYNWCLNVCRRNSRTAWSSPSMTTARWRDQ